MFHLKNNKRLLSPGKFAVILLGAAISSFGIYNIHRQTHITEGGVLGMILLLNNWFGISPSLLTPILDILCYAIAFRYLGKDFIKLSLVSTLSLSGFFKLWELFPPVLPNLSSHPVIAAVAGGLFVGTGVGLIIRQGASSGGDDALALILSKVTHCRISRAYLATDITVLALSLSYIPLARIGYSLITVLVSSLLIEYVQKALLKNKSGMERDLEVNTAGLVAEEDC